MAIKTIFGNRPYIVQYIFSGKAYQCHVAHQEVDKNGGEVSILVRVGKVDSNGGNRLVHIVNRVMQVEGGGYYDIEIIEAPTVTDVGTQIGYEQTSAIGSFSNLNRQANIKTGPIVEVYAEPTYTGGLVYDREFIPVGGSKVDTGEFDSIDTERVLNPNTDYIIKVVNTSTVSDGTLNMALTWYESGE